jgi:TPR repeat protein
MGVVCTMSAVVRFATGVVFVVVISVNAVLAGDFEDAREAYNRHDYALALRLFRPLADKGNADAQAFLGLMYDIGDGVPQDSVASANWYRKAADRGL